MGLGMVEKGRCVAVAHILIAFCVEIFSFSAFCSCFLIKAHIPYQTIMKARIPLPIHALVFIYPPCCSEFAPFQIIVLCGFSVRILQSADASNLPAHDPSDCDYTWF